MKVTEILDAENLVKRVDAMGRPSGKRLQGLLEYPWVGDVRSLGMSGRVCGRQEDKGGLPAGQEVRGAFDRGGPRARYLSRVVRGHILFLAPPFIITEAELDALFQGIRIATEDVCPSL